jgi:ubiquinone/menaquinone biosynthesis C-methylase UbiE
MLEHYLAMTGRASLDGLRVIDLGCGFGGISLYLAFRGAEVLAVDPNVQRQRVGAEAARHHDLAVTFCEGRMESIPSQSMSQDLAIHNNALCYVVERRARSLAIAETFRVLLPGGSLVSRNPNRWTPIDPFTRLPGLSWLPPRPAKSVAAMLRRPRSNVRLLSAREASEELEMVGFVDVRAWSPTAKGLKAHLRPVARYQHLSARRPHS